MLGEAPIGGPAGPLQKISLARTVLDRSARGAIGMTDTFRPISLCMAEGTGSPTPPDPSADTGCVPPRSAIFCRTGGVRRRHVGERPPRWWTPWRHVVRVDGSNDLDDSRYRRMRKGMDLNDGRSSVARATERIEEWADLFDAVRRLVWSAWASLSCVLVGVAAVFVVVSGDLPSAVAGLVDEVGSKKILEHVHQGYAVVRRWLGR